VPRISLKALDVYPFQTRISVRVTDLNYGGHLGNDTLLSLVQEARAAFLNSFGFSEKNVAGAGLIMSDAVVRYHSEAFAGDELRFEVAAGEPGRCGFRLFYRIVRPADMKVIALAETGMVCLDYDTRQMIALPEGAHILFNNDKGGNG